MRCLVLGSLMISPMKTENIKSFWCSGPGRRYNHANGGRRGTIPRTRRNCDPPGVAD